jgi:tRNA nucleotidyltransferase (CCA-adding enzyme)
LNIHFQPTIQAKLKTAPLVWEPHLGVTNRTYPDQIDLRRAGDGSEIETIKKLYLINLGWVELFCNIMAEMKSMLLDAWPSDTAIARDGIIQVLPKEQISLLKIVADEAERRDLPLYLVGGFMRDLLLGYPITDFDLVVEGDAISLAHGLAKKHGGKVTAHAHFGTAQWFIPRMSHGNDLLSLDLISSRSETYKHHAALPTVKFGAIKDDLQRRDFTINTLALRLDGDHFGELRDDLGGLEDLRQGIVRVLHENSFLDDPTRIFRAVRYEQRYLFKISKETLTLIPKALHLINKLSAERVRHELELILEEETAVSMLKRLAGLNVLLQVHSQLTWNVSIQRRFKNRSKAKLSQASLVGWLLWLMDIPCSVLEQINQRLHFPATLRDDLYATSKLFASLDILIGKKPSQSVAILEKFPIACVEAVALSIARGETQRILQEYLNNWRYVKPKANGHTLGKLGLLPGPEYQRILRELRNAWLDGEIKSEDMERRFLKKLL